METRVDGATDGVGLRRRGPGSPTGAGLAPAVWLLAGLAAVGTVAVSPAFAVGGIVLVIALGLASRTVRSAGKLAVAVLVAKPLIDLTWRWSLGDLWGQRIHLPALVALWILVVAAAGWWLRRHQPTPLWPSLLLLVACGSVALHPSSANLNELVRFAVGVSFLFLIGPTLARHATWRRFADGLLVAVSVPLVLAFAQRAGVLPYEYWDWLAGVRTGRVTGTYPHPLGLVVFLCVGIPLACERVADSTRGRAGRSLAGLFLIAGSGAIVLTYHRMALVMLLTQFALWLALAGRRRQLVVLGVAVVILGVAFADPIAVLFENLVTSLQPGVASSSFLRGRGMTFVLFARSFVQAHPLEWAIGRGGSLAAGWIPGYGFLVTTEPHSDFVRILHAYGVVGLSLYLSVLLGIARDARALLAGDPFERTVGRVTLVVLAGVVLLSLLAEPTRSPSGSSYLFALGAVAARLAASAAGRRVQSDQAGSAMATPSRRMSPLGGNSGSGRTA